MARFLKYRIPDSEWATLQSKLSDINCHVVILDLEEGFKAVDILWEVEPLSDFTQYEVYPSGIGKHTFLGCENLYELEKTK